MTDGDGGAVRRWLRENWPTRRWQAATLLHGAFHEVAVLADDVVARVATGPGAEGRVEREARAHAVVASSGLRVTVPEVVAGPLSADGRTGFLTSFVPGTHRLDAEWADVRSGLADLLDALGEVDPVAVVGLPEVRAWCGGDHWPAVVRDHLVPRLPDPAAKRAQQVVVDVLQVGDGARPVLVHGDFGLHNVLWRAGSPSALVDLDHAALGDPAVDVAPLVGAFGAAALRDVVDRNVLEAASLHRASLPLQVAAAAQLCGRPGLRDHALRNFVERSAAGTLYDPGGRRPG